ncbi:amidase domain-containing protein [Fredinandcohnia quinoae]|uniref:Amidase domain-containing protein n=1 Tax=Fredinandcohnia quinoae TaxID=2918902 RepID=A0AAW5DUP2_9BACI|nr:amidase domain-containing protein [Fredinandcohnia sp. SECRCQ15]MCH1624346.1 amidase domain-containing protein [Fredinandcohnia sp. SECRCQ15]
MREMIEQLIEARTQLFVGNKRNNIESLKDNDQQLIQRKKELFQKRSAEIVKCHAKGQIINKVEKDDKTRIDYKVHYQFLIRQNKNLYMEEQCEVRRAIFSLNKLQADDASEPISESNHEAMERGFFEESPRSFTYNRLEAVRYAETWWNSYNPKYKKFNDNCTNYISQCLHAGDAPMHGYPNRSKGWWMMNNNWSYSWTVANALRWYLSGSQIGLRAKEVSTPQELLLGDIICYDFEGDGRYNHNTIVVAKDFQGYPLVNAQSQNSRMRYWSYEDSTAYTPNIKYKFFHIINN